MWVKLLPLPACARSGWTLCDPKDFSLPGSSVHEDSQARILEWLCHIFPHRMFLTQGSNLRLLRLLHWQTGSLPWCL